MKRMVISALLTLVLVVVSLNLLDLLLASWVAGYLRVYGLNQENVQVPDLLLLSVAIISGLCWAAYFLFVRRHIHDRHSEFVLVTGTVLPLSFALKAFLKWVFGRTETRAWLSERGAVGFHWFAGTEGLSGFPSGHMLVYTPLLLSLWHFYPRYRRYYELAWAGLCVALIATQYHFLSDIIAGAYIGALVLLGTRRAYR